MRKYVGKRQSYHTMRGVQYTDKDDGFFVVLILLSPIIVPVVGFMGAMLLLMVLTNPIILIFTIIFITVLYNIFKPRRG